MASNHRSETYMRGADGHIYRATSAGWQTVSFDDDASELQPFTSNSDCSDHSASRAVIEPGDHLSARAVIEPGDGDASRAVIEPGEHRV